MACFTCSSNSFRSITAAMAKAASAKLRSIGAGRTFADWPARAAICERCPMRVVSRGVSYCGTPFLHKVDRDPEMDGCGCPTRDKAMSPEEHCPLTAGNGLGCQCKWCVGLAGDAQNEMASASPKFR
jgi:hypothetical protein